MTSTDLTTTSGDLADQINYAKAVSTAALLPAAYRGKPADILIATGLGNAIGIPPAQALYEIYVVNGRPSPSANLMAALVRRAGHKLRVSGDAKSATATLIRADDPEAPFTTTWTWDQAVAAKLTNKDTWKQYPQAMLRARAISEVVRMGAPEAVLGMEYSREEMGDVDRPQSEAAPAARVSAADFTAAPVDVTGAPEAPEAPKPTQAMTRKMFATLRDIGVGDRASGLAYIGSVVGREVGSSSELTRDEVSQVIDAAETEKNQPTPEPEPTEDTTRYDNDQPLDGWPEAAQPGGAA